MIIFVPMLSTLSDVLLRHQSIFHPVLPLDTHIQLVAAVNLSEYGADLPAGIAEDLPLFVDHMNKLRDQKGARYLVGGYGELRHFYARSELFDTTTEPRRLHLGTDIWGVAGTPVYAFSGGMVHSVGYNHQFGDYGATLILLHQLEGMSFYTLYGHISKRDIQIVSPGQYLVHGQTIAHFGKPEENGQWPPHLHFQIITDLGGREGDFPGVCRYSEQAAWLDNCPDPDLILQMNKLIQNK